MSEYMRERVCLIGKFGSVLKSLTDDFGAIIAGGAITSIFSGADIRDFDLFFPSPEQLDKAIASLTLDDKTINTDSALSIIADGGSRIQLVKILTGSPQEIIQAFDFTICQAAYADGSFVLGPNFLRHLAQRKLVFNTSAGFPICSLYRARKFLARGFHLSGIEAIKLGLKIQSIEINTYADLRSQLMGIDTLFLRDLTDSLKSKEQQQYDFNEFLETLESWLEKLDTLTGGE